MCAHLRFCVRASVSMDLTNCGSKAFEEEIASVTSMFSLCHYLLNNTAQLFARCRLYLE